jgi:hypothetical protein
MGKVLEEALAGAAGGALGTVVLRQITRVSQRLPEPLQPPPLEEDPGEHIVWRAEMKAMHTLPPKAHALLGRSLHWAYGMVWPSLLLLTVRAVRTRRLSAALGLGAVLGGAVWALGYLGWLPRTHLLEARMKRRVGRQLSALAGHVLYGAASMLPPLALRRLR